MPYVGWVCCWFSPLLREVFLWVLRFSPLLKNQHFQIPIRSGTHGHVSTSSYKLLSAPWVNKLQFTILQFFYIAGLGSVFCSVVGYRVPKNILGGYLSWAWPFLGFLVRKFFFLVPQSMVLWEEMSVLEIHHFVQTWHKFSSVKEKKGSNVSFM